MVAGLRGVQFDVLDAALFALEPAQRFDHEFRRLEPRRDRSGDLTPHRHPPLLGEIALFGEAVLPDRGLETGRIEIAVHAPEIGVVEDHAPGLGVGLAEPHPPGFFVQGGFGDGLLQNLPVKAEGAGLVHRQGTAELTAELLQLVGVELAEFSDRDLGAADGRQRRLAESLEDVGDPPNRERKDQHTHHDTHDGLANPI